MRRGHPFPFILLPLRAVGLRAPQTVNSRPFPHRHNKLVHAVCSCGPSLWEHHPGELSIIVSLPSSRFQLSHSHPFMRSRQRIHIFFTDLR